MTVANTHTDVRPALSRSTGLQRRLPPCGAHRRAEWIAPAQQKTQQHQSSDSGAAIRRVGGNSRRQRRGGGWAIGSSPAPPEDVGQAEAAVADSSGTPALEPGAGQEGAPAAPAAQPSEEHKQAPLPSGKQLWRGMLSTCWVLVQRALWPLLATHAIADAAIYLVHRFSHRATNEAAIALLAGGTLTPAAIGNMWWLSVDPALANFQTGYQPLTFVFFLLTFPIVVAIKSWAALATVQLCQKAQQPDAEQQEGTVPWWQPLRGVRQGLAVLKAMAPQIRAAWRRVFFVELLVASAVVPLTFASLAVVTLPLTLPIILDLQAAGPSAVVEATAGMAAVKRSRQLLRGMRWQLAIPFAGLVAARRLLEAAKTMLINAMPQRFYLELIEIPVAVLVGGTLLTVLLARLQDVLPYVAFQQATALEQSSSGGSTEQGAVLDEGGSAPPETLTN